MIENNGVEFHVDSSAIFGFLLYSDEQCTSIFLEVANYSIYKPDERHNLLVGMIGSAYLQGFWSRELFSNSAIRIYLHCHR
jgi:hypothetical protein